MKINTAFYPLYTQYLRQYYEISQKDLAKNTGISNSSLSKIEAGKQEMDDATFKKAISFFENLDPDFHFSFDLSLVDHADAFVFKCIQSLIFVTYPSSMYEIENFIDHSQYRDSFAFFHYLVVQNIYECIQEKDCMESTQYLIDSNFFVDPRYYALLYDINGASGSLKNDQMFMRQIQSFQKALGFCHGANCDGLRGLILYHLILIYKQYKCLGAFQYLEECEHSLEKAGAYRRLLYAKLNKGNFYIKLGLYTLAQEIYRNLEHSQSQIDEKEIISRICASSSWCSLLQGKYEEAIEKARKAERLGSRFPDIYITFAYGYYKLGDIQSARQSITRFRHSFSSDPRVNFINSFFTILERIMDDKNVPDYLIERLFKKLPDFRDVELEMVLYPLLSDYYCSLGSFQEAYRIQKRWNDYLQFANL